MLGIGDSWLRKERKQGRYWMGTGRKMHHVQVSALFWYCLSPGKALENVPLSGERTVCLPASCLLLTCFPTGWVLISCSGLFLQLVYGWVFILTQWLILFYMWMPFRIQGGSYTLLGRRTRPLLSAALSLHLLIQYIHRLPLFCAGHNARCWE